MITHNWTEDMSVTTFQASKEVRVSVDSTDGEVIGYVIQELELPCVAGTIVIKAVEA